MARTTTNQEAKLFRVQYLWKIDDFSFRTAEITSDTFSGNVNGKKIEWCLKLHPDKAGCLTIHLHQISKNDDALIIKGRVKFSFVDGNSSLRGAKEFQHPNEILYPSSGVLGTDTFYHRRSLLESQEKIFPRNSLRIDAELTGFSYLVSPFKVVQNSLGENMESIWETKQFSDVTLIAEEQEFPAHKVILAAQSAVFSKMFEHDMKEAKENRVDIKDIAPEVVEQMLQCIYTGKPPKLDEMAKELLVAAEKYALEPLKTLCEEALFANLTIENVTETLVFADQLNAKVLKSESMKFMIGKAENVMKTLAWKEIAAHKPQLAVEVLSAIVEKEQL